MYLNFDSHQMGEIDLSFHWYELKKEEFENVFRYIPIMEAHFQKSERLMELDCTEEASMHFFNIDDLKWDLYKELAFIGLVTDSSWPDASHLENMLENPSDFHELDYMSLCKMIAISTSGSHFSDGYFDRKIKNRTVLKLLQALSRAIDKREKAKPIPE
ncbi:DUF6508 domain-containing protein [Anditalea andensis]|uniref:Uncharacterized protein n=1 Tax=Anditalea andensis TaxID=1048983 RepID=A0A074L2W2_9BACT|nr:DUF6508 domain-containing protein [Anditalea andensis]KEO74193.1 hypothetical protein EL17_08635 [Anditalea andensis]